MVEQTEVKETKKSERQSLLKIKPGMTIRVHQKIKEREGEKEKERVQIFEGIVIARKGKNKPEATITIRKISKGIGVEKIFPLFSPLIEKIEVIKQAKVRRAKLYYLRNYKKKLKER